MLLRLHSTPTHFYKKGKGRYKAAPADALKAALASIERKKKQAELQARYAAQLERFEFPEELRPMLAQLLYQPDKGTVEFKALEQAAATTHLSIPKLLEKSGALASSRDYHFGRFLYEYFPRGMDFDAALVAAGPGELELSPAEAFSIDDATTTEIDDAFSGDETRQRQLAGGRAHRRAGAGHCAGFPAGSGGGETPVHGLFPGRQDHHVAGSGNRAIHAGRGA